MVSTNKLRGKIVERGMTVGTLSKEVGMDRSTLYRKLRGGGNSITIKEAQAITKALLLSREEAHEIFFAG